MNKGKHIFTTILSWLIAVVLVLVSINIGFNRSYNEIIEEANGILENGKNDDGISLYKSLGKRVDTAYNLAKVCEKEKEIDKKQIDDIYIASDALKEAKTLEDKFIANRELTMVTEIVLLSLMDVPKGSPHVADAKDLIDDLRVENTRIENDPYNQWAKSVNRELNEQPTKKLMELFEKPLLDIYETDQEIT